MNIFIIHLLQYLVFLLCFSLFVLYVFCYCIIHNGVNTGLFSFPRGRMKIFQEKYFYCTVNIKTFFSYMPSLIFCCLGKCFVGLWRGFFNQKRCRRKELIISGITILFKLFICTFIYLLK